jgi:hypothetical protein
MNQESESGGDRGKRDRLHGVLSLLLAIAQLICALINIVPALFVIGPPCAPSPEEINAPFAPLPWLLLILSATLAGAAILLIVMAVARWRRRIWWRRASRSWGKAVMVLLALWCLSTVAMWADLSTFPYYPTLPILIVVLYGPLALRNVLAGEPRRDPSADSSTDA